MPLDCSDESVVFEGLFGDSFAFHTLIPTFCSVCLRLFGMGLHTPLILHRSNNYSLIKTKQLWQTYYIYSRT